MLIVFLIAFCGSSSARLRIKDDAMFGRLHVILTMLASKQQQAMSKEDAEQDVHLVR